MSEQAPKGETRASRPHSLVFVSVCGLCALLACAGFLALGTWQVHRLHWKLDLIKRVNARVSAPAQTAPGPSQWGNITADTAAYRHVKVTGQFLYPQTTRVKATTRLGGGFWVITPLQRADGSIVLINRGFISSDTPKGATAGDKQATTVTGLLRISEPGGAFLHDNDPTDGRWYSRDVQAIAKARGLTHVAPYFIDAAANGKRARLPAGQHSYHQPVAGLTRVSFRNSHLSYAITWYILALMMAAGIFWVARYECKLRRAYRRQQGKKP